MLKTMLIRFGWVVFERSQVSKNGKKNQKFDYSEGHNFFCKKIGRNLVSRRASHNPFYLLKTNSQI